jgi:hypothetical protein
MQESALTLSYRDGTSLVFSSLPRLAQLIAHKHSTTRRYIICADKKESLNNQRLFEIVTADVIMNSPTDVEKLKNWKLIFFCKE